ncbi:MAG: ACT domain-containing protein [Acidimicrobiales bacterium]
MPRYAVEISLQDEPGALGTVASLIGKLGGDVVDVDVLEYSRGWARDEITVELAGPAAAEHLGAELAGLPGVEVEHLAPVGEYGHHLLVDALEVAGAVIAGTSVPDMLEALASGIEVAFGLSWVVVVSTEQDEPLATAGGTPPASVSRAGGGPLRFAGSDDCLALGLGDTPMTVVLGREQWPFRNRERRELTTLAHIAATRYSQLAR